eukprot:gene64245-87881_t
MWREVLAHAGQRRASVTANVAPKLCADFQAACASGDYPVALGLHDRLFALHTALFTDASPGPIKYALTRVRKDFPPHLRLPMTWPGEASRAAVDKGLLQAGLLPFRVPHAYIATAMARPKPAVFEKTKIVAENRRAKFDYFIDTVFEAGIALTGTEEQPYRAQVNYVDFATALHGAFGAMVALRERDRTGRGQQVSGSLLGSATAMANVL